MMGMNLETLMAQMRSRVADHDLKPELIRHHLGPHPWNIHVFGEVDSTNTLLKKMAREGAPAGTVVVADRQTGGRGRMGRTFLSPGGVGVYLSARIRPDCEPGELMHLTCAVAVAMCNAVTMAYGFRPKIKWTNDLVAGNKKLGGILTELGINPQTGRVDYAILGIGINCGQLESDFDESIRNMATSARMVLGRKVDRNKLIAEMVRWLSDLDHALLRSRDGIMKQYRADCMTLGKPVSILRGDEVRHAVALDIDGEGGLIVRYDSGETGTVTSGEVSVRGLYGYL